MGAFDRLARKRTVVGASIPAIVAYAKLKAKWSNLENWNVLERVPDVKVQHDSWVAFRDAWEAGDERADAIQAQSIDVEVAENRASDYGYPGAYKDPRKAADGLPNATTELGDYGSKNKVAAPPVEESSDALHYAEDIDSVAKAASNFLDAAAKRADENVWDALFSKVPKSVLIAGGLAVAGLVTITVLPAVVALGGRR